jgi:hypothetical protein
VGSFVLDWQTAGNREEVPPGGTDGSRRPLRKRKTPRSPVGSFVWTGKQPGIGRRCRPAAPTDPVARSETKDPTQSRGVFRLDWQTAGNREAAPLAAPTDPSPAPTKSSSGPA